MVILFLIVLSLVILNKFGYEVRPYIREIKKAFSGVVIKKYYLKVWHMNVKTSLEIVDITSVSDTLIDIANVGDSIYKPKNRNYVILFNKNGRQKLKFMFIPISVTSSKYWPKEFSTE